MSFLLLFLFAGYALHRELRICELRGVVSGAWSRKDGVCAVAKVSASCYRRLLDGKPCVSAERASAPPLAILVDELKSGKRTRGRITKVTDLRSGEQRGLVFLDAGITK